MKEKHRGEDGLESVLARAGVLITPRSVRLDADLSRLVEESRKRTGTSRPAHRVAWTVALGLLFTSGAAAAAATGAGWAPWAADPDVTFTYSLPSGLECEQRIGVVEGGDPAVRDAIRDIVEEIDVVSVADTDSRESMLRENATFLTYAKQVVDSGPADGRTVDDLVREAALGDAVVEVI